MKQKLGIVLVLLALMITACGANPIEQLEDAAAEQIAETIIEQATGIEDIEINTEDGSASYTIEDEDGEELTISTESSEGADELVGMGFSIDLPDGIGNGRVQQIDENGEASIISGVFEVDGVTLEQFYNELHPTLISAGFTYVDMAESGKTEPDTSDPINSMMTSYQHSDGVLFTAMWGDTDVILGLTKATLIDESGDAGAESDVEDDSNITEETAVSDDDAAAFDGSINADKPKYAPNEEIVVTFSINTPLADDAWVGIVPSDTPHGSESENDAVDIAFAYMRDAQDGVIILEAPYDAGNYDIRLFSTDADGVELDSIFIIVGE